MNNKYELHLNVFTFFLILLALSNAVLAMNESVLLHAQRTAVNDILKPMIEEVKGNLAQNKIMPHMTLGKNIPKCGYDDLVEPYVGFDGSGNLITHDNAKITVFNLQTGESIQKTHFRNSGLAHIMHGFLHPIWKIDTNKDSVLAFTDKAFHHPEVLKYNEEYLKSSSFYKERGVVFGAFSCFVAMCMYFLEERSRQAKATLKVFDIKNNTLKRVFQEKQLIHAKLSHESNRLFVITEREFEVYDLNTNSSLPSNSTCCKLSNKIAFSKDDTKVANIGEDGGVKIFDIMQGVPKNQFSYNHSLSTKESVSYITFSSDGKYFLSATNHGQIQVWNIESSPHIATITQKLSPIEDIEDINVSYAEFSPDNERILLTSSQNKIAVCLGREDGQILRTFNNCTAAARYNSDGTKFLVPKGDEICIYSNSCSGCTSLYTLQGHTDGCDAYFDPSGSKVIGVSKSGKIRVWNIPCTFNHNNKKNEEEEYMFGTIQPQEARDLLDVIKSGASFSSVKDTMNKISKDVQHMLRMAQSLYDCSNISRQLWNERLKFFAMSGALVFSVLWMKHVLSAGQLLSLSLLMTTVSLGHYTFSHALTRLAQYYA